LNAKAAAALFVAIVTDTGRFNHSNSTPDSFRVVASLIEDFGLKVSELTQRLYRSKSIGRIKLEALVAETIETRLGGKIVVARVSAEMLAKTGCDAMDAAETVTIPKSVEGGMVCVMFSEMEPQLLKCSLRSEGQVKVNEIAAKFGGGGHNRASGLQVTGRPIAQVEAEILAECERVLSETLARTGGAIIC
jgi:phosphoesterase RecJ-like protein